MKNKKLRNLIFISSAIFLILGLDSRAITVNYKIYNKKIDSKIKIGLVSDLHSCDYGENQIKLTEMIDNSKPDILLLGGDIVDDEMPEKKAWEFLSWAGKNYPTYYVTGNHEFWIEDIDRVLNLMKEYNITTLHGEKINLKINNQEINLFGIDDPTVGNQIWIKQLENITSNINKDTFSILLSHRPEKFELYQNFDLTLTGHAHGGQWRIPYILNGLIAPNQGLFPKYTGGLYDFENNKMIVSRGLARESTRIPRFYNRPEYVLVEVLPE